MAKPCVHVLIEGFVDETRLHEDGVARYQPTITLIRIGQAVMIVDPGTLCAYGASVGDVTHVIVTHPILITLVMWACLLMFL